MTRQRIELQREDLIRDYEGGTSFAALGAKHGVSRVTIANRLHEWGANIRPSLNPSGNNGRDNGSNNGSDPVRNQILELEGKIVEEGRNLQLAYDHKRGYELELAVLKGAVMRRQFR